MTLPAVSLDDKYTLRSGRIYLSGVQALVRLLMTLEYDIIHMHFGGNLTARLLGLVFLCTSIPRTKTVLTFHSGGYPTTPAGKTARPASLRGFVLRRLDCAIGVNVELTRMFQKFGLPASRTRTAHTRRSRTHASRVTCSRSRATRTCRITR